jgi:chromosome segregation ATPase
MTKKKDDGAKHSNEQLAAMTKAIRDAKAEVQESREREATLSKQVSTLESQADTLKGRLSAESDIAQRELKKSRLLEKKIADQQREWTKALREKDEVMRREILATEERLHRTLGGGEAGTTHGSHSDGSPQSSSSSSSSSSPLSPSATALVRTVEELNRKFAAASSEWQDKVAEEQTMLEQEELMSRSMAEPRERVRELEDHVQSLQSEMCVMVKDVSVAKKREQELQRRIAQANGEKQKMEEEVSVLQQSVKAMSSMDGNGGSANDADRKVRPGVYELCRKGSGDVRELVLCFGIK